MSKLKFWLIVVSIIAAASIMTNAVLIWNNIRFNQPPTQLDPGDGTGQ